MGRKEFASKTDALAALEMSKTRVSEIMMKARQMQFASLKVGRQDDQGGLNGLYHATYQNIGSQELVES